MDFKIAFLGDTVLEKTTENTFSDIEKYFRNNKIQTCINLESPFLDDLNCNPIKDKVCLSARTKEVSVLHKLNPFLINLSNNHINDYGNESSLLTIKTLSDAKLPFWGIGTEKERNNVFFDNDNKIIYIAYTTRSSDLTGSMLFAEDEFIGPYEVDLEQVYKLKKEYTKYNVIVNIHWGIEDIHYPEPEKRTLGKKIIDAGADLIIGHHPHIIQPYEKYKEKYIFYSIGNFYFPEIEYTLRGRKYIKKPLQHQRKGIVPVFGKKENKITLNQILLVKNLDNEIIFEEEYSLKRLKIKEGVYIIVYGVFYTVKNIYNYGRLFFLYLFTDRRRLYDAIKKRIRK